MNKNLMNIEQLLHKGYTLDDAMSVCGYTEDERDVIAKKFSKLLVHLKYKNKQITNSSQDIEVCINIDDVGTIKKTIE